MDDAYQRLIDKMNSFIDRLDACKAWLRAGLGLSGFPVPWTVDPGSWGARDSFVDGMSETQLNTYAEASTAFSDSKGD